MSCSDILLWIISVFKKCCLLWPQRTVVSTGRKKFYKVHPYGHSGHRGHAQAYTSLQYVTNPQSALAMQQHQLQQQFSRMSIYPDSGNHYEQSAWSYLNSTLPTQSMPDIHKSIQTPLLMSPCRYHHIHRQIPTLYIQTKMIIEMITFGIIYYRYSS